VPTPSERGEWSGRGDVVTGRGPRCGFDDFEGHWPNMEDVDDDRLLAFRKKTAEALDDPILLMQQPFAWYWEDQMQRIDCEMRPRGLGL
jgi:hypothetical protein